MHLTLPHIVLAMVALCAIVIVILKLTDKK